MAADDVAAPEATPVDTPAAAVTAAAPAAPAAEAPVIRDPSFVEGVLHNDGTFTHNWKEKFKDDIGDSKYFDTFKGLPDLVKSAKGLSELKGRALVPKADADPAEWDQVFQAAGVPKTPEEYGLAIEGMENEGLANYIEKSGYLDRLQNIFLDAEVPLPMSSKLATASLKQLQFEHDTFTQETVTAREEVEERWNGRVKWDDAVKGGREALARLCEHSETSPSPDMAGFLGLLDKAGLSDHPYVVSVLQRMSSRMAPARVIAAANPTGPGVKQPLSYARIMAPRTVEQVLGGSR